MRLQATMRGSQFQPVQQVTGRGPSAGAGAVGPAAAEAGAPALRRVG
jgi:hypothetical protein